MVKLIKNKQKGFSIIEILIAITFIAVIITGIFNISRFNSHVRKINDERTQSLYYAVEGIEAAKLMTWDQLAVGNYHFVKNGAVWEISAGSELLNNKYTRTVAVSAVSRQSVYQGNVYGDINTGSNVDPDTKKVVVTIDWLSKTGANKQEKLETYVYRFRASRWTQQDWVGGDGQSDWSDASKFYAKNSGADVTIPGVATLISGALNWNIATTTAVYDAPGNSDNNDVFEINNIAYLVTENNTTSPGSEFYILDVANINFPPIDHPPVIGQYNVGNGVTSVVVQGNYAYLTTRDNSYEFQVFNISNPASPQRVARVGLDTDSDALDVVVNQNQAYIVQGSTVYSYNITNPNSPQRLDTFALGAVGNELFLNENYLYVATNNSNKEIQVINVTDPNNMYVPPAEPGFNLTGSLQATDIKVRGDRAYVSTITNSGAEFYIINFEDKVNPVLMGYYEVGANVYSFGLVGPYALLGTALSTEELRVVDISYPVTVKPISSFDLTGYIYGMTANCSNIYAGTTGNNQEFFIVSTLVTNCDYASSGYIESSTLDTGSAQVAYNWIKWTGVAPLNTAIKFQLATSENIAGPWAYVGPDGTGSSFYTNGAGELINYNFHLNKRYIRYKLFLENNNSLQPPTIEEVIISYSTFP
ncbi:MAG: hypothetical protein WCV69_03325 [Patescibacteria group bacterium]|jgi:Tfp pilus assembly protein PilV